MRVFGVQDHSTFSPLVPVSSYKKDQSSKLTRHEHFASEKLPSRSDKVSVPSLPVFINIEFGWDRKAVKPAPRPIFFTESNVKVELDNSEFELVLERLETFFKHRSIQAIFSDAPASAKLQTVDSVELCVKFWEAPHDQFSVDIQRHRGDHYKFHDIMHQVLDVVKGVDHSTRGCQPMDLEHIKRIHSVLEKLSTPQNEESSTSHAERIIRTVHSELTHRCFLRRAAGLNSLMQATDMRLTTPSVSREVSTACLTGRVLSSAHSLEDADSLNSMALQIQSILLRVLLERDFEGDEGMKEQQNLDIISQVFMATGGSTRTCYENTMLTSVQKVLTIFANSLESISIEESTLDKTQEVLSMFMSRCQHVGNKGLVASLVSFMDECQQYMALAYLACRVLRLLLSLYPPLKDELRSNAKAQACVEKACQAGRACHSLLETESLLLRDGIMAL